MRFNADFGGGEVESLSTPSERQMKEREKERKREREREREGGREK